jgi:hypothetical protein
LEPGDSEIVKFRLEDEDLAFVNSQNEWVTEQGDFSLSIDSLNAGFYLKAPKKKSEL